MELKENLQNALQNLRKEKERKFDQSVDFVINLQKFDVKRTAINTLVNVPHKIKDKKIGAFLEIENENVHTITSTGFKKYTSDKKAVKKLVDEFDFFIAQASLMPKVATIFGRYLGPAGKMPSPQLGILMNVDDKAVLELKEKINSNLKIRVKEASVKLCIGKQSMSDHDLIENAMSIYNALIKVLPRDKENIKNIQLKFTMTKPVRIAVR